MPGFIDYIKARVGKRPEGERRAAPRFTTHLEKQLVLNVSFLDLKIKSGGSKARHPTVIAGYTHDISESGLGIIVPTLRLGGLNITRPDRTLRIMLALPGGTVEIHGVPVRHSPLEKSESGESYLIGVRITKMSDEASRRYKAFLSKLQRADFDDMK